MYSQYPQSPYGPPQPPPQQPKKTNYWLVGCFGCGGLLALVLGAVIIIAVVVNSGDDEASGSGSSDSPSSSEGAGSGGGEETAPANNGEPVSIVAESTEYVPSAVSSDGEYVAVHVTVTNNGDESLSVNPLYFSMEDSSGSSTDADLMESSGQDDLFEAKDLAPGDSEDGVIVFPGSSEPATVTHTSVMGEEYSAEVS